MGRSADSKFGEADELDKRATNIQKRDPESSRQIHDLARSKRKSATKQMRRKPGKKGTATRIIGR